MMEGVSSEAASFAGHQMLGNLCWLYDSNRVTIEGHTDLAFSDDVAARFLAYGWNVLRVGDANDTEQAGAGDRDFPAHAGRADPHHRRQPYRLRCPAQARHELCPWRAARRGGGAPRQTQLRLARRRQVLGAGGRARTFPGWHGSARPQPSTKPGSRFSNPTGGSIRTSPISSSACRGASFPRAGTRTCPSSLPTRRASPVATPPARCSTPSPRIIPGSSAAQPTSRHPPRPVSPSRGPAIWKLILPAGAICISGFASMPWERS